MIVLKVSKNQVEVVEKDTMNSGEYKVNKLYFEFSDEYSETTNKAIFQSLNGNYEMAITNGYCDIPAEILAVEQEFIIGVYGYTIENEELKIRYSPSPVRLSVESGSYISNADHGEEITPSQFEQYSQALNEGLEEAENVNIDMTETSETATITITNRDGEEKSVTISKSGGGGGTSLIEDIKVNNVSQPIVNKSVNITVPTDTNELTNSAGYINEELDPTVPSYVKNISENDISSWNGKSDFSGDYNDLTNKPTIPANTSDLNNNSGFIDNTVDDLTNYTKTSSLSTVATSGSYTDLSDKPTIPDVSNFITKDVNNLTYYTLKTATGSLIDLEINGTTYVVTLSLKDVDGNVISTDTIDLPLETVVVGGSYDNVNKKVVLTLENGNTVEFSVADLVAGLQTEITSNNKLASDLVDDTNSGNKFTNTSEKATWNAKYDKPSGGIPKTDLASDVQTSLGKADTAIQQHQDLSNYALKSEIPDELKDLTEDSTHRTVSDTEKATWNGKVTDASYVHTDNNFTSALKTKLENDVSWSEQNQLGSKNLIPYNTYNPNGYVQNGITFTLLEDGSIVANGTKTVAANNSTFNVSERYENTGLFLPNGTYILTGCPSDGSANKYQIGVAYVSSQNEYTNYGFDNGEGLEFTVNGSYYSQKGSWVRVFCVLRGGYGSATNLIFRPMIRLASIKDATYEAPANTNRDLTLNKLSWEENKASGVKNYFTYPYNIHPRQGESYSQRGVIFTDNEDGGIKANGVNDNTGNSYCQLLPTTPNTVRFLQLPAGKYVFSGGISEDYYMNLSTGLLTDPGNRTEVGYDYGTGFTFEVTEEQARNNMFCSFAFVKKGKTADNVTFYPMIRRFEDTSVGYANFALTNTQLTKYKCDMDMIAPTERGAVATHTYAVGDYMFWRSGFYKVNTAINTGDTIDPSYVTQTTIGAELKAALTSNN